MSTPERMALGQKRTGEYERLITKIAVMYPAEGYGRAS